MRAVSAVRRPQWLACAVCATLPYVEAGQTMTFLFLITLHGGCVGVCVNIGLNGQSAEPPYIYGVRLLQTRLSRDQLDRADAGSWQIADRYATAS